jgi:hypothetical protein
MIYYQKIGIFPSLLKKVFEYFLNYIIFMNIIPFNNCKIVNIIWIDRGILLSIMSFIIDNYTKLLDKILIINNKPYRNFLRIIFNKLVFSQYKSVNKKNFYFNIRQIIKNQDVIIDYLQNYTDYIYSDKINLIPWYDMNDPIILYEKNKKTNNKLDIEKYKLYIKNFSSCRRGNYNNTTWDLLMERYIFIKYNKFNYKFSLNYTFNLLNKFILNNYTDTTNTQYLYLPIIDNTQPSNNNQQVNSDNITNIIQPNNEQEIKKIKSEYNNKVTQLVDILSNNINNIYNIIN